MTFLLVMMAAAAVIVLVTTPFRRGAVEGGRAETEDAGASARVGELEAAREAKYREIRDAELDHRTGKLSDDDFHALDNSLRAEAISILQALDRAHKA
jgi:hypothetical protein